MFINAHLEDFKHLSLCQIGLDMNPNPLVDWITHVGMSEEQGCYNLFADKFLSIANLIIHGKPYDECL